jgi:hypothetical protein
LNKKYENFIDEKNDIISEKDNNTKIYKYDIENKQNIINNLEKTLKNLNDK